MSRFITSVQSICTEGIERCLLEIRFNIFMFENDSSDHPHTPKPEKIKKFWSFIKSLKKDTFGITSLRENGILKTDAKEKADICNRQFQSAFTREGNSDMPSKGDVHSPPWGT